LTKKKKKNSSDLHVKGNSPRNGLDCTTVCKSSK